MKKLTMCFIVLVLVLVGFMFIRDQAKDGSDVDGKVVADTNANMTGHPPSTNRFREVLTVVITNTPK